MPHGARYYRLMISLKITIVAKTLSRETEVFILVTKLKRGVTFGPIVVPHRLQTLFADVLMLEMGVRFQRTSCCSVLIHPSAAPGSGLCHTSPAWHLPTNSSTPSPFPEGLWSQPLWIDVFQNPGMGQSLKTDSKLINGKGNDRILWLGRNSLRDLEKHLESFGNGHMVMPQYGSNGWAWPKEVDWIQLSNSLRSRQAATYVGPPNLNMVSENSVAIKIAMAHHEKLHLNSPLGVILHIFSHTQMDPKQKQTFNKTCH